jgi:hypothetical protein
VVVGPVLFCLSCSRSSTQFLTNVSSRTLQDCKQKVAQLLELTETQHGGGQSRTCLFELQLWSRSASSSLSTRLPWLCFVSPPLVWGCHLVSIRHASGDRASLVRLTSESASHSWVPSCRWCRQEYVNRMNLESMRSIWLVYLYCLVAENRPRIRENSTLH